MNMYWVFNIAARLARLFDSALNYAYGVYLTLRFVDEYEHIPAIIFSPGHRITLQIQKAVGAKFTIRGRLTVSPWLGAQPSFIRIFEKASLKIEGDFVIGDGVSVTITEGGDLLIGGRDQETISGITANCVVLVNQTVEIGKDALIAWDTVITDSDWHQIEGQPVSQATIIGDHVWIATGAKILKGVQIGGHSIVAAGAVVTRGKYKERSLLAGVPAKVIKENISEWHR